MNFEGLVVANASLSCITCLIAERVADVKIAVGVHDVVGAARISRGSHQDPLPRTQRVGHVEQVIVNLVQEHHVRVAVIVQTDGNGVAVVVGVQHRLDPTTAEICHVRHVGSVGFVGDVDLAVCVNGNSGSHTCSCL